MMQSLPSGVSATAAWGRICRTSEAMAARDCLDIDPMAIFLSLRALTSSH
jgi:hypothetical protein